MDRFEELEPGQDDFPLGPHPLAFVGVLVAVLGLAYVSTNVFFERVGATSIEAGPNLVELPELVGLDDDDAISQLEQLGFEVVVEPVPNTSITAGQVIAQLPTAGSRVSKDLVVTLTVSAGSAFVSVPDVQGSPMEELELMLFAHGVALGEITEQESDLVAGEVVSQQPPGGEVVAVGTPIDVVISSGPPIIEIPDVDNLDSAEAAQVLRDAGFTVVYEDRYSSRVRRGNVIRTDPSDEAPRGSHVTLEISRGPAPPRPTVTQPPEQATSTTQPGSPATVEPSNPTATTVRSGPSDRPGPPDPPSGLDGSSELDDP